MRKQTSAALGLLVLALSACSDLALEPPRVPTTLALDAAEVTVTEGEPVALQATVLDQNGDPLATPEWVAPVWESSNTRVVKVAGQVVSTIAPGQAIATATVAGISASAVVRVNPSQIRLSVDSVAFLQNGSHAGVLAEGVATTLRVFLTADQPNFFEPTVRVNVLNGGTVLESFDAPAPARSIPQRIDPSNVWEVTVPASLVRPGNAVEVIPDPTATLPHVGDSHRRYPSSGPLALRFAVTFSIASVQLTQSVQRADGSVPLVVGRDALLRVFATSDVDVQTHPIIRATFMQGGSVMRSYDIERAMSSFPRTAEESFLTNSWNVLVPGSLLQSGVSLVVEIDPDGTISRTNQSSPRYPATGAMPLNVREVPPLWLRLIPVYQTANGTTGNVGPDNLSSWLERTASKFPLDVIDADIRAPYSTDARLDTESGWVQLLREIAALRDVDGSGRYYYGVHRNPPGSPWGGLGFIGWPAAIGYDAARHGWETMAHELGHNFDLLHAPCGGPASVDRAFPYPGGGIGVFGFDLLTGTLKKPTVEKDLMSYCSPEWISDYNYVKIMDYREANDWTRSGPDRAGGTEPSLLVWGGVENGRVVLEPAFELDMRPKLPSGKGPYRIQGLDDSGNVIFSYDFTPEAIDHTGDRSFSFAIPSRIAQPGRLARLRLNGPGDAKTIRRPPAETRPEPAARRVGSDVTLSWQSEALPMALVRDARTGEVLSFARNGAARVRAPGRDLEIIFSDGVRSVRSSVIVR